MSRCRVYCGDGPEAATFGRVAISLKQKPEIDLLRVHVFSPVISLSVRVAGIRVTIRNAYMPHTGHDAALYYDRMSYLGLDNQREIFCTGANVEGLDERSTRTSPGARARAGALSSPTSRAAACTRDGTSTEARAQELLDGEQKRIEYIFASDDLKMESFETMTDLAGRSDHFPLRAVFAFKAQGKSGRKEREEWGMAKGWKPKNIEQYNARIRQQTIRATSLDDLILGTEVSASAEAWHRPRGPQNPAEAEVCRLLRSRRAANSTEDRRKAACELHETRREATQQRVERGRLRAAKSGAVQSWRDIQRTPESLPRIFENSDNVEMWPELLQNCAAQGMAKSPGLEE